MSTQSDRSPTATSTRDGYHHGNLIEALLAAAIELIEEKGVEALSIREVSKRAGVSPAAPFRHFSNKTALLTAVAEQAMARLVASLRFELENSSDGDSIDTLHAIGRGYLGWALANPTHFQIISSRSLIDFHSSAKLVEDNEAIRLTMLALIERGKREGVLRSDLDVEKVVFTMRAFAYGVARMWVDNHFREWKVKEPPETAMSNALDMFMSMTKAYCRA